MEILLERKWFTSNSTVSEVSFDGVKMGFVLEDVDRNLDSTMPLTDILARKIHGITAIPTGRYEMVVTYSDRFKRLLPLLLNVKGFAGIRWHVGNTDKDTDGCSLVGLSRNTNFVGESRDAFAKWFPLIQAAAKKGKVFVTITRNKDAWRAFMEAKQAVTV